MITKLWSGCSTRRGDTYCQCWCEQNVPSCHPLPTVVAGIQPQHLLHKELLLTPDIASTPQLGQLQAQLARLFERSKRKGERDVNHRAAVSRPLNKDGVFELKMEFAVSIGSLIHGPGAAPTAPHFPEIGTWGSCGRRTELSAGRGAGGSEGCSLSAPLPTPQPRQESGGSIPDFKLSAVRLLQQESGRELPAEWQFQGKLLCATTFCKRAELQRILPRL
ncbi:uncharacterized protein LOC122177482 [Lagopus leucura]|uniref:uncharacterized protein LOC122177482 n=1 Tax=Lagopus leucura TaxID=30410 RepID=UPI001C677FB7|nr:uncharacterized protein LOC122177482 [Lagopus leucura]